MNENIYSKSDEITLKEIVLKAKEFFAEALKYWWVIVVCCAVFACGFLYRHNSFIPKYIAELRFVVEGQNGAGSGLSNLLGSFGIKKGGKINPYKVIEVGKSTDLLIQVLREESGSGSNIANSILEHYDLQTIWGESDERFREFTFSDQLGVTNSSVENEAIKRLRAMIWGNKEITPLIKFAFNEDTGIYSLTTNCAFEDLSLELTTTLYNKIKYFFEQQVFENQKQLADILSAKADSIKTLNESTIRRLARFEDSNRGGVLNATMVQRSLLAQENLALTTAYAEVVKTKEMTDVNLKDIQPLFMMIDAPFGPLTPTQSSLLMAIIKGIIIGGFFSVLFIILRKIYIDTMSS